MGDDLVDMGPVDYLVVEFPGSRMTGEGLPLLLDLVDRGTIRVLDLVFVRKELDGTVRGMAMADFDADGDLDLAVFEGASSGLIDDSDLDEASTVLAPGNAAAVIVYETWWPRWTRPRPRQLRGERDARSASRSRPYGRDRRYRDRGVQPGIAPPGRPVGRAGAGSRG
jgi:uncharacterized protein DUF6325